MTVAYRLFGLAVPIGTVAFCWVTMETVVQWGDESMTSYGFPIPWCAPSAASSLAHVVGIGPLIVDLAVYVLVTFVLVMRLPAPSAGRRRALLTGSVWLAALGSAAVMIGVLASNPDFASWTVDDYFSSQAARVRRLHVGPMP